MDYVATNKELVDVLTTDLLPVSDLEVIEPNRNGVTPIDKDYRAVSTELPDTKDIYQHEKTSTTRILIPTREILLGGAGSFINKRYHSYYFKPTQSPSVRSYYDEVLAQSALELYPTPIATYASVLNPYDMPILGTTVVDLNHLKMQDGTNISSKRLDVFLSKNGLGKDINSFVDLQNFINNETILKQLTPNAILQIALCSYFIPNIIGETDPNSRNIILLFNPIEGKYDIVVRIDAEGNTYRNQLEGVRSGERRIPKGIYSANECYETEFLRNIMNRNIDIDWELFNGLLELAEGFLTRTKIDDAISSRGYKRNLHRAPEDTFGINREKFLGIKYYADFSEATIKRAAEKIDDMRECLRLAAEKIPYVNQIANKKREKLEMQELDEKGNILQ